MFLSFQEWKMLLDLSNNILTDFILVVMLLFNLPHINLLLATIFVVSACVCRRKNRWCRLFIVLSAMFTSLIVIAVVLKIFVFMGVVSF